MQLYRQRKVTVEKEGGRKVAAPVRFIDAVMLLSTDLKFSAVVGGGARAVVESNLSTSSSRVSSGDRDLVSIQQSNVTNALPVVPGSSPGLSANIDMAAPFRARPMGVKRDKAENAAERGAYKMAKSMDRVSVAIGNSTKAKLLASSVAIQFKIIKSLPFSEEERGLKLMELLSKASSVEAGESNGSTSWLRQAGRLRGPWREGGLCARHATGRRESKWSLVLGKSSQLLLISLPFIDHRCSDSSVRSWM